MVHTPAVFNAPVRVFRRNIVFGREKLEWCGYAIVKKSLNTGLCLPVSTQCTNVTYNRRTD